MSGSVQKLGGLCGLIEAVLYVAGFGLFLTVLDPAGYEGDAGKMQFLTEKQFLLFIAHFLIYVVFGVVLVVLAVALHARLKVGSPVLMQVATAFGLIWAGLVIASGMVANIGAAAVVDLYATSPDQAMSLWVTIATLQEALGGGNEIVGGLWVVLVSWAGLRSGSLPKALNYLGTLVGLAGILTVAPGMSVMMDVFGLGQIAWFVWLGVVMLRG